MIRNFTALPSTSNNKKTRSLHCLSATSKSVYNKNSENNELIFSPSHIVFDNISEGVEYKKEIIIRCISQTPIQVRPRQPKSQYFWISSDSMTTLSYGLTRKINVFCKFKNNSNHYTNLIIQTEKKKYTIQISANETKSSVNYDKLINLGFIGLGRVVSKSIAFKNIKKMCKVKLHKNASDSYTIQPQEFFLKENQNFFVHITQKPHIEGTYHHKIIVTIDDELAQPIQIVYTTFNFSYAMLNNKGNRVTDLDFGTMYYGQTKQIELVAVNNTPNPIELKSKIRIGWNINDSFLQSPQQLGTQSSSTLIQISKTYLTIQPFSSQKLSVVCSPPITKECIDKFIRFTKSDLVKFNTDNRLSEVLCKYKIDVQQFHETLITQFNKTKINSALKLSCTIPKIKIQPAEIDMGILLFGQSSSAIFTLINKHSKLPVDISIGKLVGVQTFPSKFAVDPNSEQKIEIFLTPRKLGIQKTNLQINIYGLYKFQIPIQYETKGYLKCRSLSKNNFHQLADINLTGTMELFYKTKNKENYKRLLKSAHKYQTFQTNQQFQTINRTTQESEQLNRPSKSKEKAPNGRTQQFHEQIKLEPTFLQLPQSRENLFVTKKYKNYTPYPQKNMLKKKYVCKENTKTQFLQIRRVPKNRSQLQQIEKQLPGHVLRDIRISTKIISFGKIFINSKVQKQFQINNNSNVSIQVKLQTNQQSLRQSDLSPQILAPGVMGSFDIIFQSKTCGKFQKKISYIINNYHRFEFQIQAEVQLVTLQVSKNTLRLSYYEQSQMHPKDQFTLTNQGNAESQYQIITQNNCLKIDRPKGSIASNCSQNIAITYFFKNNQVIDAGQPKSLKEFKKPTFLSFDQKITIKIVNGVDMIIKIHTSIPQPKCYVKEQKLSFDDCIISQSKQKILNIRNTSRFSVLYEIQAEKFKDFLTFDSEKGRINPQSTKEILVTYQSSTIHSLDTFIKIFFRGGLTINLPVSLSTVPPDVYIPEEQLDFGDLCCGTIAIKPLTIKNNSENVVQMVFDLLNKQEEGVQFLAFSQSISEESNHQIFQAQPQIHEITIQPKSIYTFWILFKPMNPGFYNFFLPLYFKGYLKSEAITKIIRCCANQPKFILQPNKVKFKKKIISNENPKSSFHPQVEYVTLKNVSDDVLKWKIQHSKIQNDKKNCFQIENKSGQIKPQSWTCINISFNPFQAGLYTLKLPLLIYNQEKKVYNQEGEIAISGEGQYPALFFDRRQLILPVVPLNVESVGIFKIINEGYENMAIRYRIQTIDESLPPISLLFPQGIKMGINKRTLYVVAKFIAKKPISFTVKIQFFDNGRIYPFYVSGTADNSILTNFSYLLKQQKFIKYETVGDTINVISTDTRNIIDRLQKVQEYVSNEHSQLSFTIAQRWINSILRDNKLHSFPQDCSNQLMYKLLYTLTNRKQFQRVPAQIETKIQFYEHLIKILKSMGCLLNNIRPYFLLDSASFMSFFQEDPNLKYYGGIYEDNYSALYKHSWMTLFYQIASIFWYNPNKNKVNDNKSNVYSNIQIQVLKWIKNTYDIYNQLEDRIFTNFSEDLKDCLGGIHCLYHYYYNSQTKSLEGVHKKPSTPFEKTVNRRYFYSAIQKVGISPLITEQQLQKVNPNQLFLLYHQLFQYLPQQAPRHPPIIFQCYLGEKIAKYLEIKNPSNKIVIYNVKVEGSKDYSIEQDSIKLQPKSSYRFRVQFRSRISEPQSAFLVFLNKNEHIANSAQGSCLIFQLTSKIIGRKSVKKLEPLYCPLYESTSIKVNVQNYFPDFQTATFAITIIEQPLQQKNLKSLPCFLIERDTIKIKKDTIGTVQLSYHPLIFRKTKCCLIFCDPAVGEFQYQIIGHPQMPKILQEIKYPNPIYINSKEKIELTLPLYNNLMIKSQAMFQQKLLNRLKDYQVQKKQYSEYERFKIQLLMSQKVLQYVHLPEEVTICCNRKRASTDFNNKIKVQCNFITPIKEFVLDFVLISQDKRDVRRLKVNLNVISQPIINQLYMSTTARIPISQIIPIENKSQKDWRIKALLEDIDRQCFTLKQGQKCFSKQMFCKKGQLNNLILCFSPMEVFTAQCKFTIFNITTNEKISYFVKGISEQPVSQDHIFIKTVTGQSMFHTLTVTNPYPQTLTFRVITDLKELQCIPQVILQPNKKHTMNLIISTSTPATSIGYLKFIDSKDRYFWYTLTIAAQDSTVVNQSIQMVTTLDREAQKILTFKNPLTRKIYFTTQISQDQLQGQSKFAVLPCSVYHYKLKYKPVQPGKKTASARFFCPEIGAFKYQLNLTANNIPKKQLTSITSQIGKTSSLTIKLENRTKNSCTIQHFSNNDRFEFIYQSEIAAQTEIEVKIIFHPMVQGKQQCSFKFFGENFPAKYFQIEGIGLSPFTIETIQIKSSVLEQTLKVVKFSPPISTEHNIECCTVTLQTNHSNVFCIIGHDNPWEAKIEGILGIPIQFYPKSQGQYEAMLRIQALHYQWKYLLRGATNTIQQSKFDQQIVTKAREQVIKLIKIPIPQFLRKQKLSPNKIQFFHHDPIVQKMLKNIISLRLLKNFLTSESEEQQFAFYLKFKPKKPMQHIIKITAFKQGIQSTKVNYRVNLIAKPPSIDAKITIQIDSIKRHNFDLSLSQYKIQNLENCKITMQKAEYFQFSHNETKQNSIILKFNPSNCTFKARSYYDVLIVQSANYYWNFEIEVLLNNFSKLRNK